ncbi:XapX domain-containing protein [Archangium violaceum]|uniref:DUF1427 family protein n=1 Tax=Archangium violaceum TaxID=83451 RepID=UPI002B2F0DB2|nr:XapX domain-containing protein [Archangium violaceum]
MRFRVFSIESRRSSLFGITDNHLHLIRGDGERLLSWKFCVGLLLGLAIGFGCRWLGIPVPAPPMLVGASLVVAMTSGYLLADHFIATHPAHHRHNCGGPSGDTKETRT